LIINIIDFENDIRKKHRRNGAEKDSIRLESLLIQLGFHVTVKENLTKAVRKTIMLRLEIGLTV